ncbi:MAG: hypothetical protein IJL07_05875 [Lachnospiraceae bacterium]|nr:hypothetical protein [Lachnospiraceae bacterium]
MTPDDKRIIAVDFDGTLAFGKCPETKDPNEHLIKWLIQQRIKGNKVILWTNRSGDLLDEAVRFCRIYGLEFDAVNENLPEMIEAYGNDSRKISADHYIDDRSHDPKGEDWEYLHLHKRDLERKG